MRDKALREAAAAFSLTKEQLFAVRDGVTAAVEARLAGRPSSLSLYPSFLRRPAGVVPDGSYLALDFGGSNIRAARIELSGGHLRYGQTVKKPLVDPAGRYDYRHGVSTEELFLFVAGVVSEAAGADGGRLGHTFSFPTRQTGPNEATLLEWTKEMSVGGACGRDVQELLRTALGFLGRSDIEPAVILNDTTATLLSGAYHDPGTVVGTICGTGHNSCYEEAAWRPAMIVNPESGNFDGLPFTSFDDALDGRSQYPGRQRLEKMTAGHYLGELVKIAAEYCGLPLPSAWSAAAFTPLLAQGASEAPAILVRAVVLRAARLAAAELAALVCRSGPADVPPAVAADGSVFAKLPLFFQETAAWLPILAERPVRLYLEPEGSLGGAAIAAACPR